MAQLWWWRTPRCHQVRKGDVYLCMCFSQWIHWKSNRIDSMQNNDNQVICPCVGMTATISHVTFPLLKTLIIDLLYISNIICTFRLWITNWIKLKDTVGFNSWLDSIEANLNGKFVTNHLCIAMACMLIRLFSFFSIVLTIEYKFVITDIIWNEHCIERTQFFPCNWERNVITFRKIT